ncbi:hypothetical protein J6590_044868 [Homalodisca vitripennis]|nr:hypothetical protein J6590_044868 [Homalodisca vitripennis]
MPLTSSLVGGQTIPVARTCQRSEGPRGYELLRAKSFIDHRDLVSRNQEIQRPKRASVRGMRLPKLDSTNDR